MADDVPPPPRMGDSDLTRPPMPSDLAGSSIGPYRLLQKIGEGGMGEVWLAEQHEPIRRTVALKVIKTGMDTRQVMTRFEAERQALALMDHPAIAMVLDAGATPLGRPYFVMEYVKGEPITDYCDRHRLSTPERLGLFLRVCDGVQHAHQKGIIHRDLKPSNVLVTLQDGQAVPKIIDFGVAKATAQRLTEQTLFTELGVLIGTPEYMSPEQAEMTGLDVDTRTDVYSLGVLLYQLLAGALPFDPASLRQAGLDGIRRQIREVDPPRPSTKVSTLGDVSVEAARMRRTDPGHLVSQLKGDLDWITMRCLEKDRTRRYGSASDLAADLGRHLSHQPVFASPPSAVYRARKFARRHRIGVSVATAAIVVLVSFAVTMTVQAQRIARERDRANREALRASQEAAAAAEVADFLTGLFRVADPAQSRGRAITAREMLDKGAARIDAELARDPIVRARLLMTMGDVYRNLGVLDRAEELLVRSVDARREHLGAEAPDTLRAMSMLGMIYDLRGKTDQGQQLLESVLATERRVLGEDHANTLQTLANLANLYDSQGKYAQSGPLMREAYERRRRVLGSDHLDTLGSQYNLAVAEYRAEHFTEAERLLIDVTAAFRRVVGSDHPHTLMAKDLLGNVYLELDRLAEAKRTWGEVYDVRRRVLGPDHMDTLATQLNLANVARKERRFPEAEALFRVILATQERTLGRDHGDVIATRASLATMLVDAGRYDDAERMWQDTLTIVERALGAEHPTAAYCLVGLAEIEAHRNHPDAAINLLARAVRLDPLWAPKLSQMPELKPLVGKPGFERLTGSGRRQE